MNDEILKCLLKEHGPLMSGEALWKSLGFKTSAAFRQAKSQGRLNVHVFTMPNRRGTYAFTKHVVEWLELLAKEAKMD